MIRTRPSTQRAVKRLKEERARYDVHEAELVRMGLKGRRGETGAMDPLRLVQPPVRRGGRGLRAG